MTRSVLIKGLFSIAFVIIVCAVHASAQKVNCATRTDAETVTVIYNQIKAKHSNHMRRVNVRIKDGVVTLEGWVAKKSIRSDIEKFAKKTACVKRVVTNIKIGAVGGCPPGTKKCGDICIPEDETCNIIVDP